MSKSLLLHTLDADRTTGVNAKITVDTRGMTESRSAQSTEPVTRGTGNVFADLGFTDAAERQAKLRLAHAVNRVIEGRKLSKVDAAKALGITQPRISALHNYRLAGFSLERLMNMLTALDQDIEIVIRPTPRSRSAAGITVVAVLALIEKRANVNRG